MRFTFSGMFPTFIQILNTYNVLSSEGTEMNRTDKNYNPHEACIVVWGDG